MSLGRMRSCAGGFSAPGIEILPYVDNPQLVYLRGSDPAYQSSGAP